MRIVSGSLKGRQIFTPKNSSVRPTTDKVRAAIYSKLFDFTEGAVILELFAGTGAFGVEGISRNASRVVFVDKDITILQKNVKLLDKKEYTIVKKDALKFIEGTQESFDIIFIDPPYGEFKPEELLKLIKEKEVLAKDGYLIYEESKRTAFSDDMPYTLEDVKSYGDTKIYYYRNEL